MKVALVSFGHADSAIPMAKALSERLSIDLFFTFSLNKRKNNVIDFEDIDLKIGLQNNEIKNQAFSKEVKEYLGENFPINLFVYKNLKLKSLTNWVLSWKYAKILRKYDIIHFNGKNMNILQLRFFMPFKKFVYTVHDLENHKGELAKNVFARNFNKRILKSKSHVVIQNKSDYELVKKEYPKNISSIYFIPFGNLEIYKQYNTENLNMPQSDVLLFGRISPYKGIEYFIEAVKKLKIDFPYVKAIIAGSGKFYFDISEIDSDKNFTIINKFIQSDELVAMVKACKIVVCPYTDATQSGVAMTAFVFNKPVIASNTGGFKDVIVDGVNGFLVPLKNSEAIYNKMKILLENDDLLKKMNQNIENQSRTGDFAWSTIARNYEEVYKIAL
ncbi:MAG: glycosyltransferase family 4 protein [Bacteroidales bacterium]|nr:glycosyltransferase family 4 protein [Bacteroidales bacterium]MBN2757719.1 glycosyltransferase family 4 protein [Bacteroidales bacterium]